MNVWYFRQLEVQNKLQRCFTSLFDRFSCHNCENLSCQCWIASSFLAPWTSRFLCGGQWTARWNCVELHTSEVKKVKKSATVVFLHIMTFFIPTAYVQLPYSLPIPYPTPYHIYVLTSTILLPLLLYLEVFSSGQPDHFVVTTVAIFTWHEHGTQYYVNVYVSQPHSLLPSGPIPLSHLHLPLSSMLSPFAMPYADFCLILCIKHQSLFSLLSTLQSLLLSMPFSISPLSLTSTYLPPPISPALHPSLHFSPPHPLSHTSTSSLPPISTALPPSCPPSLSLFFPHQPQLPVCVCACMLMCLRVYVCVIYLWLYCV